MRVDPVRRGGGGTGRRGGRRSLTHPDRAFRAKRLRAGASASDIVAALPRPADKSRAAYYGGAVLDRVTVFRPLAWARERARAVGVEDEEGPGPDGLPLPPARLRVR